MTKRSMPPRFKAPCSLWRAFADFCSTCGVGGAANLGWGSFSYPQSSRWGRSCLTGRLRTSPTTTPRASYVRGASGARRTLLNMPSGRTFPFESIIQALQSVRLPQIVSPHTQAARPAVQLKPPAKKGQVYFGRFYMGKRQPPRESCFFPRGGLLAEKPSE